MDGVIRCRETKLTYEIIYFLVEFLVLNCFLNFGQTVIVFSYCNSAKLSNCLITSTVSVQILASIVSTSNFKQ